MTESRVRHLPPVRRRRSPIDPVVGTWAVIGCGTVGTAALSALRAHGVPALGYDAEGPASAAPPEVRWEHRVIDVEEVEDVDQLAVTSEDAVSGEINTDYVAGVVVAVRPQDGWPFVEDELMNVHNGVAQLAHGIFTPRHPGIVVLPDDLATGCEVVASYAAALWRHPRGALGFHRRVCEALLPGWPQTSGSVQASDDDLRRDLAELVALRTAPGHGT